MVGSQFDDKFLQGEIKFCSRTIYFFSSFFLCNLTTDWTRHCNCAVSTLLYSLMWNDIMFPLFLDKLKHKLNLSMSCGFDLSLCLWFISLRQCYGKIFANCLFLIKLLSFIGVNLMIFMPWSVSAFPDAWHERDIACLSHK